MVFIICTLSIKEYRTWKEKKGYWILVIEQFVLFLCEVNYYVWFSFQTVFAFFFFTPIIPQIIWKTSMIEEGNSVIVNVVKVIFKVFLILKIY